AALAQERACSEGPRPGSLLEVLSAGLVGEGNSILVRDLESDLTQRAGAPLEVANAWSYRAVRQNQVAVELRVQNTSALPWTTEGAELVSTEGVRLRVVRVWQAGPVVPGEHERLVVEAEAPAGAQSQGTFLLKLHEAGGVRTVTVRGVTFP
ncbi:MAG TPA: DUF2381 family protein, partial [Archangium sp.]|nr:DUF2381 family protein [Archangium sp.]